ncbi:MULTISPECIES: APC family permease [Streptomycetaceae]|uniref:Amino acid/polyamine transporter n=1 Tax=Streptantibioticus cattleyicolor (strain ATCC 35852 / DSM 46488 / JCM 4925 / NBRC 14057 / NRRL 8057) TaxID=1003195 RepID=F8K1W5_STREN|nr:MULTISPECIES: APC family permease [Streptomycetaceae]AEW92439.1 amino acid/polyamine transporter [Streptantibioticus cattleyicolor NRRL 8057 = DSM 46488]MYS57247.1 amino acid permease [Streptomyces sp. SID5468]CCB72804.1 Amino acid/polyamine transporter [Streptantibioticus cattleyicolor NRRL 8057 = DSM 46488]
MASVDQYAPQTARDPSTLRRDVGLIGLMWASVGSIIGSGWLYGAKNAVVVAGPAAIISWGIGAVAIVLLALVHAELGGLFPVAGGTARYPHYAFGGLAGMSFGWFSWLQAATVAPIEVEAMIGYAGHWHWAQGLQHKDSTLTISGFVVAVVLMAVFVAVNFLGVRLLAHTNSAATWWKVAVPLFTIFVLAATHFHGSNFTSHGFAPFGVKGILGAISTSGIIFALLGFEQAIQLSGESRNPKRDIPRATLGSVAIGALIYLLLQVVFIGALPGASFAKGWANLDFAGISGPFAGLATLVGLGWLGVVLYVDAVISPGGTGLIYTTSTSRISYGLSKNGYAPKLFESTDKRGVPWFGLIISFVTGVVCFLPFPSWQQLVSFITSASVLMYAGAPLAFGVLRDRLPERARPYRLPGGSWISPVSFVISSFIIYWSGWGTLWRLGIAIVLGYLLLGGYATYAHRKGLPQAPRLDWKAAQWLPVYLIGMGVISWQGGFGDGSKGNLPLWWDMAVIAVFSLGIYYWARATALPAPEIERNIADVTVVDEGGH